MNGMAAPMLYVCHGDDGGPRVHPCRRVQEALREAGIEYDILDWVATQRR